MKRKVIALTMTAIMLASLGACGGGSGADESAKAAENYEDPENLDDLDYEFGEGETFHSGLYYPPISSGGRACLRPT